MTGGPKRIFLARPVAIISERDGKGVRPGTPGSVGARIDQVPIEPHMILSALGRNDRRVGPASFPAVDFGAKMVVPTPQQGGDGKAISEFRAHLQSGMRAESRTMTTREEALSQHRRLTTD